jgi:myo-inositol 2-dehydrogenase/D-chiro-inositol 1-dehydrogenase
VKKVGVIGAGAHSALHCAALKFVKAQNPERLDLSAISSRDQSRAVEFQKRYGFKHYYSSVEKMLSVERLDGLLLMTPEDRNAEIARSLLPHGIPLLIEKPPGLSSEEAHSLHLEIQRRKLQHMTSYNRRFSPAFQKALDWIAAEPSKRRPVYILARMLRHKRWDPNFVRATAIHAFDPVLLLLGDVSRAETFIAPAASTHCRHFYPGVHFRGGGYAELLIAPDAGIVEESYEIHGPSYRIFIDYWRCRLSIAENDSIILKWESPEGNPGEYRDGTVNETLAFLSLLEGDEPSVPTVETGASGLRLAEAIEVGGIIDM